MFCLLSSPLYFAVRLTFCDGSTDRCVDPKLGCIPVMLCYTRPIRYPPLFSLDNVTFHPLRSLEHTTNYNQNETSASFCVLPAAFETTEEVRIWVKLRSMMAMPDTNNSPVVLHAIQGVHIR